MSKKVMCYRVVKANHPEVQKVSVAVVADKGGTIGIDRCSACFEDCVVHVETLEMARASAKTLDANLVVICHECHDFMEKPCEATA